MAENMPEFGIKSNNRKNAKRPIIPTPTYQTSSLATRRIPSNRSIPHASLQQDSNLGMAAKPRSRFSVKALKHYVLYVTSILAVLFLVCTIYLLATRNKQTTVPALPTHATVSLSDLESTVPGFYSDKIKSESADYELIESVLETNDNPLSASLSKDNNNLKISVNWSSASTIYNLSITRNSEEVFDITSTLPIADFTIFTTTEHENDTIILLMADGTIEFIPIKSSLQNRAFYSHGKIVDLSNIVKFYHANTESGRTVLAQTASGEIYDLSKYFLPQN